MIIWIVAMILELLMLLAFVPIVTAVSFSVVTDKNRCIICLDTMKIRALTIKIKMENGTIRISVNGKKKDLKHNDGEGNKNDKKSAKKALDLPALLSFVKYEKIIRTARILGVVGADDAAESSMWCAMLLTFISTAFPFAAPSIIYPDFNNSRLDMDAKIGARISLLQALEMAYISR